MSAVLSNFGLRSPRESRVVARGALDRALAIEPDHQVALATLGWWMALHEWNWTEADALFGRVLSAAPSSLEANGFALLVAACQGRDVTDGAARLVDLDPLSPWTHGVTAVAFNVSRRPGDADRASRAALELRPDSMLALWSAGDARRALGD